MTRLLLGVGCALVICVGCGDSGGETGTDAGELDSGDLDSGSSDSGGSELVF